MDIRAELANPALSDEELLFKFLHLDKMPPWAYEVAKEPDFTLVDKDKRIVIDDFIEVKKIVGTNHMSFCNQTWIHNLRYPAKPYNLLEAMKNPDYYTKTLQAPGYEKTLGFIKIDDEIYIDGDGNHRSIIAKFLGIGKLFGRIAVFEREKQLADNYNYLANLGFEIKKNGLARQWENKWTIKYNDMSLFFPNDEALNEFTCSLKEIKPSTVGYIRSFLYAKFSFMFDLKRSEEFLVRNYVTLLKQKEPSRL